jgi:FHA domain
MAFTLVITAGNEVGREFAFDQREVMLGRTPECDVILTEAGVSRQHARIVAEGLSFFLEDLGSSHGTHVNGAPISKRRLKGGDAFALGPVCPTFQAEALSAAERARLTRRGRAGRAMLRWLDTSTRVKAAVIVGLAVLLLAPSSGIAYSLLREPPPRPTEPMVLGSEPIRESFGLGKAVSFERADEKVFYFQVNSPAAVVAVLHYQSKDIDSADEVSIAVNGTEIGWLTPDTLNSDDRGYELLVPSALIKPNQLNILTFDNLRRPPDVNPWRVWNVWLESDALPDKSDDWLISDAEEKLRQGLKKWSQRDIGAANRWQAYRHFREAWLTVEAIPAAKRRPVYLLARAKMLEARTELDVKCRNLLIEAQRASSQHERAQTIAAFQQVEQYFPSRSHPCQDRAEYDRAQLGL